MVSIMTVPAFLVVESNELTANFMEFVVELARLSKGTKAVQFTMHKVSVFHETVYRVATSAKQYKKEEWQSIVH